MKRNLLKALLILLLVIGGTHTTDAQIPEKFIGSWEFNAPTAGSGFETGIMEIKKDSVITTFTVVLYKIPSFWVKYESDTLKFNFDVEGESVYCYCTAEDASNLKGYAEWSLGETILILTRSKVEK